MVLKIGQNSLEVCKEIIRNCEKISNVYLIAHHVGNNWRQINSTPEKQAKNLLNGLITEPPIKEQAYNRESFLKLELDDLENLGENVVWSITSKVKCFDGSTKHMPMINFHPEEGVKLPEIIEATKLITDNKSGFFLETGRYYHYYGNFLLDNKDWTKFLSRFLASCFLVSPRYIAHRIYDGYCTLRLTTDKKYKPKIPTLIKSI